MSFHLTSAYAVPAGVVIGALISFAGQHFTNQANLQKSRADRLWDKRADLYLRTLRLADSIEGNILHAAATPLDLAETSALITRLEEDVHAFETLHHECRIFGSDRANAALSKCFDALIAALRTIDGVMEAAHGKPNRPPFDLSSIDVDDLSKHFHRLSIALRADLSGSRRRSWLRLRRDQE